MRTAFIEQLIEEARFHPNLFLMVGDLGFSVIEPFAQEFPDRFLNAGIAEQNMAGMAAGLAKEGYNVYIYSIGNFPTLRCIEQIRYDICYHNLNVKIVGVGGGFAYGSLGASHHATEEFGMLRTIPNMVVCAPGDPVEARRITTFSANYAGPLYIRLGKAGEPVVHKIPAFNKLTLGQVLPVTEGIKTAVFSTGSMLKYACDFVAENSLSASVYSFPFIKPINKKQFADIVQRYEQIITIEEHQAHGGFGSAVLELANDLLEEGTLQEFPHIRRIAIKDQFYSVAGSQEYLRATAELALKPEFFKT